MRFHFSDRCLGEVAIDGGTTATMDVVGGGGEDGLTERECKFLLMLLESTQSYTRNSMSVLVL